MLKKKKKYTVYERSEQTAETHT